MCGRTIFGCCGTQPQAGSQTWLPEWRQKVAVCLNIIFGSSKEGERNPSKSVTAAWPSRDSLRPGPSCCLGLACGRPCWVRGRKSSPGAAGQGQVDQPGGCRWHWSLRGEHLSTSMALGVGHVAQLGAKEECGICEEPSCQSSEW